LLGRCYCGAVEYAVEDAFLYAACCHCSRCRAVTGSAFKAFGGIDREKFEVTKGKRTLTRLGDANHHDARCAKCGSLLFSVVREGKFVHVPLGTLVDAPSLRPTHHIFVGSKAPWHKITDKLPQYEGHSS